MEDEITGEQTLNGHYRSAGIIGSVLGAVYFLVPLLLGYMIIANRASGDLGLLLVYLLGVCFACLLGVFGGFTAVWHYLKSRTGTIELGKAASIGFVSGVVVIMVNSVLGEIWTWIDPEYLTLMRDEVIAIVESADIPESQKQNQIDTIASMFQSSDSTVASLFSFLAEAVIYGTLNLLTGMLGAKVFGNEEV